MKALSRILSLCLLLAVLCCLGASAADGQTLYNSVYCFTEADFADESLDNFNGIFVTAVPEDSLACLMLGSRMIRPGDVLSADSLRQLKMQPRCEGSCDAVLSYQPICGTALGAPAQLTIRIQSGKNEAPKALGTELETYKNIANNGKLSGTDPEGACLSFQVVEQPKRGSVKLEQDGTFIYTPDKNKVGQDSFTFTVTDEAGNVSKPATVKINILKPTESMSFTDLSGSTDCFEAMWLWEQGILSGEKLGAAVCFRPEEKLSRGEFLVMAMKLGGISPEAGTKNAPCFTDVQEDWLLPYLAAAQHKGIISGERSEDGQIFRPNEPITGQEAAVMLQNILKLPVPTSSFRCDCDIWAKEAVMALSGAGLKLPAASETLTRLQAAVLLYEANSIR